MKEVGPTAASLCARVLTLGPLFSTVKAFPEHLTTGELKPSNLSNRVAHAESLLTGKPNTTLPRISLGIAGYQRHPWGSMGLAGCGHPSLSKIPQKPPRQGQEESGSRSHLPWCLPGCYSPLRDTRLPWSEEPGGLLAPLQPSRCTPAGTPSPSPWRGGGYSRARGDVEQKLTPGLPPEITF